MAEIKSGQRHLFGGGRTLKAAAYVVIALESASVLPAVVLFLLLYIRFSSKFLRIAYIFKCVS